MEDHHVDRPEVEAEQSAQLTGTNRSSGASSQTAAHSGKALTRPQRHFFDHMTTELAGLVAIARGQTPDPIPNSAVKTLCADGTAAQAAEE